MSSLSELGNFIIGTILGFVIGMCCMAYNWNETLDWWKEKIKNEMK